MGPNTKHVHTLTGTHMHAQKDWQQHINEIKKVKEENKHVKQNARRASQQQVASQGRLTPQMAVVEFYTLHVWCITHEIKAGSRAEAVRGKAVYVAVQPLGSTKISHCDS